MTNEKPLFVPLFREHFNAFLDGSKRVEFRKHGARWNRETCRVGRRITLSCGYNGPRLHGTITRFDVSTAPSISEAWRKIYGDERREVACIRVRLDGDLDG